MAAPKEPATIYTEDLVKSLCSHIMQGYSLRDIAAIDGMPSTTTIFDWIARKEDFAEQYARAKEVQADYMGEEILDIADDGTNDWMERKDKDGNGSGWTLNGEHVQRSRLRVDSRKWLMSKFLPKKYGERRINEHTGADGGPIRYTKLSEDELDTRLAELTSK